MGCTESREAEVYRLVKTGDSPILTSLVSGHADTLCVVPYFEKFEVVDSIFSHYRFDYSYPNWSCDQLMQSRILTAKIDSVNDYNGLFGALLNCIVRNHEFEKGDETIVAEYWSQIDPHVMVESDSRWGKMLKSVEHNFITRWYANGLDTCQVEMYRRIVSTIRDSTNDNVRYGADNVIISDQGHYPGALTNHQEFFALRFFYRDDLIDSVDFVDIGFLYF